MNHQITTTNEMEELNKPLIETRDFHGYFQYLDTLIIGGKEVYCWRFCILGFTADEYHCYIFRWDKSKELIAIDDNDQILINGKLYGPQYWNH